MSGDNRLTNPERDQDRAFDLCECWQKYGYVMFPQQRSIYRHLQGRCAYRRVLEAGAGDGVGGAQIEQRAKVYLGTDKLASNVHFARCLYPWITFDVWDIAKPWHGDRAETVVCVEAIEHVADPEKALRNLLDAATVEVWLSTPNGLVKREYPPSNPYHCREFEPQEMFGMFRGHGRVTVHDWQTFDVVQELGELNPIVYRVMK